MKAFKILEVEVLVEWEWLVRPLSSFQHSSPSKSPNSLTAWGRDYGISIIIIDIFNLVTDISHGGSDVRLIGSHDKLPFRDQKTAKETEPNFSFMKSFKFWQPPYNYAKRFRKEEKEELLLSNLIPSISTNIRMEKHARIKARGSDQPLEDAGHSLWLWCKCFFHPNVRTDGWDEIG